MAENIRNIKLRLNLDKPEARRANEILSSSGRSMSQFIIAAVNAYGSYLDEEEAKRHFVQQVNDSLRRTLQEMLGSAIVRTVPAETVPEASSGNQKAMEMNACGNPDFLMWTNATECMTSSGTG